ncbi:hypothetical protein L1987_58163 [Smallanthus sonchifolius]|uniref:Uncharacterized protein n=1 Tax=Smallanthus sonchifolius TaxID=185202 RepID=A0ACB9DFJ9_9ASTR|nr:hypothetical protein L1987_58163 [Smallanthus sonchifolius]
MEQMVSQLSATHFGVAPSKYGIIVRQIRRRVRLCGDPTTISKSSVHNRARTPLERLEQPKPRTRESARKKTHLPKKVTFKNMEKGEPSTRAPLVLSPQDPTKDYIQLYGYFDWKAEVNENLRWLTSRGTDMNARLDFHTELATDMSGQMSEMEQDIMQNHDKTTAALKEARAARI